MGKESKVANISQQNPLLDPEKRQFMLEQAQQTLAHFPTLEGYIKYAPSEKNNNSERVTSKERISLKEYINRILANNIPNNQFNFFIDPCTATPDMTIVAVDIDDHDGEEIYLKREEDFNKFQKDFALDSTFVIKTKSGKGTQHWYLLDTDRVVSLGKNKINPVTVMGHVYNLELVTNLKGKKTLLELPGNYSVKESAHYRILKDEAPSQITSKLYGALSLENKVQVEELQEWESQPNNKMFLTNPEDHPDNITGFTQYLTRVIMEAIKSGTPPASKSNRNNMCLKYISMGSLYNLSSETIVGLIEQYLINSPQVFPDGNGDTDLLSMANRQREWAINNGIRGQKDDIDVLAPFAMDDHGYVKATRKQVMNKAREVLRVSQHMRFRNETYRRAFYSICFNVPGGKFVPHIVNSNVISENLISRRLVEEEQNIDVDVTQSLHDIAQREPHWKFMKTPEFNDMMAYINSDGKAVSRTSTSKEYLHYSLSGYQIENDSRYLKQDMMISGNMIFLCEEPAIQNLPVETIPKGDFDRVEKMWRSWIARIGDPEDIENDYEYITDYYAHTIQHMDGEPNALIFVGRAGSGKSAMMGLLRAMLPFGYSANIANQNLLQNEFMMLVKLLCIDDLEDLNSELAAVIKALLTGSEFLVNRKFKDMVNMIIKMSIVGATNNHDIDFKGLDARRVSAICNYNFVDISEVRTSLRHDFLFLTRTHANIDNYYFRVLRTWFCKRNVKRNGWFYLSRYQKDRIMKGETSNTIVIILANLILNRGHVILNGEPFKLFEEGAILNRTDIQIGFDYYLSITQTPDEVMPIEQHSSEMHKGDNMTRLLKDLEVEYRKAFKTSFGDPHKEMHSVINPEIINRTWTFVIPSMQRFKELLALATEKSKTVSAISQVMDRYSLNKVPKEEIGTRRARLLFDAEAEEELY